MGELLARPHVERVLGLDIKPPAPLDDERFRLVKHDVCQPCSAHLRQHGVQALVHLAFCFAPARDRQWATRVNVEGTRQVLSSCLQAGVQTVLYCSSGTAYGALPDNPLLLGEEHPLRASWSFQYAYEKRLTDELFREFAGQHPDRRVIICRPPVVMGPHMDNYLSRMITKPVIFMVRGQAAPMQFIHERDVVEGIAVLLERADSRVYNFAPADTITLPEVGRLFGRKTLGLPAAIMYPLTQATYWLGIRWVNEVPAGFLDYIRYRWVLDATRADRELGWGCRYSTRQAVEDWQRAVAAEGS